MKAYKHLVKYALAQGLTVSVWDGEVWSTKRSTNYQEIIDDIEGLEDATLRFRDPSGFFIASALVSAHGLADTETVIDYTDCDWMQTWNDAYDTL